MRPHQFQDAIVPADEGVAGDTVGVRDGSSRGHLPVGRPDAPEPFHDVVAVLLLAQESFQLQQGLPIDGWDEFGQRRMIERVADPIRRVGCLRIDAEGSRLQRHMTLPQILVLVTLGCSKDVQPMFDVCG